MVVQQACESREEGLLFVCHWHVSGVVDVTRMVLHQRSDFVETFFFDTFLVAFLPHRHNTKKTQVLDLQK